MTTSDRGLTRAWQGCRGSLLADAKLGRLANEKLTFFFFARGGLRMAKSNCRLITVGSYLKAQGVLVGASAQSYDLELQQSGGKPLARHVICGLAQIDTATFDRHERSLMASEFMETVFWRNCCFEYRPTD